MQQSSADSMGFPSSCIGIMAELWQRDGLSQKELGTSLIKTKSSINKMLDALSQSGMIIKKRRKSNKTKTQWIDTQLYQYMKATIMKKSTRKNIISAVFTVLILAVGIFDGRLQAHERVNITSKVQGLMQQGSKSVREGAYFKKGDVLFTIDNREANFNLKAQKSALMTTITSMMPDLKFDYVESFGAWQSYLSSFDVDRPITTLPTPVNDQEKFFVSGRNIYNQYYTIKGLETRLADYTIYAPFSGVVTAANVFPGALISPGQPLATMINTERYEIASPVPLENLKYIKTGQEVILESEEMGKSWKGKVNRIGTQIDPNTQNLPVYISVYGRGLKDGMYLKGRLNGAPLISSKMRSQEIS